MSISLFVVLKQFIVMQI